jgi:hypothetical protein
VKVGQIVPSSQPSEWSENAMLGSVGGGGSGPPRWISVTADHPSRMTTITVVTDDPGASLLDL